MKETIFDIIVQVRPKKVRPHMKRLRADKLQRAGQQSQHQSSQQLSSEEQPHLQAEWTASEQHKFVQVAARYGRDYSTLNNHFPQRSRKQIIRRYERLQRLITRMEHQLETERRHQRKCIFETEVLELETTAHKSDDSTIPATIA